jgi:hypothetical protein
MSCPPNLDLDNNLTCARHVFHYATEPSLTYSVQATSAASSSSSSPAEASTVVSSQTATVVSSQTVVNSVTVETTVTADASVFTTSITPVPVWCYVLYFEVAFFSYFFAQLLTGIP